MQVGRRLLGPLQLVVIVSDTMRGTRDAGQP